MSQLIRWFSWLLVANIAMMWYSVYELRCYNYSNWMLRSVYEHVEANNQWEWERLESYMREEKIKQQVNILNKGIVNIKRK